MRHAALSCKWKFYVFAYFTLRRQLCRTVTPPPLAAYCQWGVAMGDFWPLNMQWVMLKCNQDNAKAELSHGNFALFWEKRRRTWSQRGHFACVCFTLDDAGQHGGNLQGNLCSSESTMQFVFTLPQRGSQQLGQCMWSALLLLLLVVAAFAGVVVVVSRLFKIVLLGAQFNCSLLTARCAPQRQRGRIRN